MVTSLFMVSLLDVDFLRVSIDVVLLLIEEGNLEEGHLDEHEVGP